MKVRANTPVRYKGVSYGVGQEFDITREDYDLHKKYLQVTEDDLGQEKGLAALTAAELKELAKEKNIDGFDKMKKAELMAALEAGNNGGSTNPENPPTDPGTGQE